MPCCTTETWCRMSLCTHLYREHRMVAALASMHRPGKGSCEEASLTHKDSHSVASSHSCLRVSSRPEFLSRFTTRRDAQLTREIAIAETP